MTKSEHTHEENIENGIILILMSVVVATFFIVAGIGGMIFGVAGVFLGLGVTIIGWAAVLLHQIKKDVISKKAKQKQNERDLNHG